MTGFNPTLCPGNLSILHSKISVRTESRYQMCVALLHAADCNFGLLLSQHLGRDRGLLESLSGWLSSLPVGGLACSKGGSHRM